jgi:hypothetical protein
MREGRGEPASVIKPDHCRCQTRAWWLTISHTRDPNGYVCSTKTAYECRAVVAVW